MWYINNTKLIRGNTKMKKLDDTYLQQFIEQQFGKLTVVSYDGFYAKNRKRKRHYFKCKCSCGNSEYIYVTLNELRNGETQSCGCIQKELAAKNLRKSSFKDGRSKSPYYPIYRSMISRCYNPNDCNYKYYGEKGIVVCEEWKNDPFMFFEWAEENGLNGREISIDRIDVNGNYSPENCRAADTYTQRNNTTRNRYITYQNKTQTLTEWCRELNLPYSSIKNKIYNGYKLEDIIKEIKEF